MYLDIYAATERSAKVQTSSCTDICNSGDNEASDIFIWNVTKLVSLIGRGPHNMDCDPQYGWRRMDLWYMDLEQGRRVTTLFNLMTKYFFCEADLWGNVYFITTISTAGAHRHLLYNQCGFHVETWAGILRRKRRRAIAIYLLRRTETGILTFSPHCDNPDLSCCRVLVHWAQLVPAAAYLTHWHRGGEPRARPSFPE